MLLRPPIDRRAVTPRRCVHTLILVALCTHALVGNATPMPPKPNIILILADDLGFGDVGCYNDASRVPTPNLDRLAEQGIKFIDAHSPATVCTPTRYSLMTGQMAFRVPNGSTVFTGVGGPSLIASERITLPEMLRESGYATACVGKWHIGLTFFDQHGRPVRGTGVEAVKDVDFSRQIVGGPLDHGFAYFFGTACCPTTDWLYAFIDGDRVPVPPTTRLDRSSLPRHPYANDCRLGLIAPDFPMEEVDLVFLEKSREFLVNHQRTNPHQPFFLFHSTQAVHLPSFPATAFQGTTGCGPHGDFIHQLDHIVGQLLATCETLGIDEETLVIFTSDNGPEVTSVIQMRADHHHDGARPWRGVKRDSWEGGHRVPLLMRWPGRVEAGSVSTQTACLTDLMATFAEILGVSLPDNAAEDSFSLVPAMRGQHDVALRPYLITQAFGGERTLSIRRGPWKYLDHRGSGGNRYDAPSPIDPGYRPDNSPAALFDLEKDPGERRNLLSEHPGIAGELKRLLEQSKKSGRSRPTIAIVEDGAGRPEVTEPVRRLSP